MTYLKMLNSILKSSGWSQEQLAAKLGVSFPTVNFWLNQKSVPRKRMQERIKQLYLAKNIPYEGPVYITLLSTLSKIKVGDEVILTKTPEDGLDGLKVYAVKSQDLFSSEENAYEKYPDQSLAMPVASQSADIIEGTRSGLRIYDKVSVGASARVLFIFKDYAVAVVEDWGIEG